MLGKAVYQLPLTKLLDRADKQWGDVSSSVAFLSSCALEYLCCKSDYVIKTQKQKFKMPYYFKNDFTLLLRVS